MINTPSFFGAKNICTFYKIIYIVGNVVPAATNIKIPSNFEYTKVEMLSQLLLRKSKCLLWNRCHPTRILHICINFVCVRYIGLKGNPSEAGTIFEVKEKIMERLGLEHGYVPIPKSRENLLKYQPKLEDLPARCMHDSFTSAVIPLSMDKELQDKYVSVIGTVRLGRLMEDMDLFAVWVCHQHVIVPSLPDCVDLPYTFVTAHVDRVAFTSERTSAIADIRVSGHVSWVGRTSLKIIVWLEQLQDEKYRKITQALFTMVARNATNTASAPVNTLVLANDLEKEIFNKGELRRKRRLKSHASSIFKVEPNGYEQTLMYNIFKRTTTLDSLELNKRLLPSNSRWMSDSFITSTTASFPEHRNAHNTVFGGYIMKSAVEISTACSRLFARNRTKLHYIGDISFRMPVSVSCFIKTTAYVLYTEANYIQIMAVTDILNSVSGSQMTSNILYFTFSSTDVVPEVLPKTYHEAIWYLQGRRQFREAMELDK